jgi:hypothetical protein
LDVSGGSVLEHHLNSGQQLIIITFLRNSLSKIATHEVTETSFARPD